MCCVAACGGITIQACIQLPVYAENMALPSFAGARHFVAPCCCNAAVQQLIDTSHPLSPQQQMLPHSCCSRRMGQTDRPSDTVPFSRPLSAYFAISANSTIQYRSKKDDLKCLFNSVSFWVLLWGVSFRWCWLWYCLHVVPVVRWYLVVHQYPVFRGCRR